MALFWKKETQTDQNGDTRTAVQLVQDENRDSDSKICFRHLEALYLMQGQGVVLKFYIENFKRMNELFGFSYCEELLENVLAYLEEEAGCTVYRYVGVEFIVILKNCSQGKAIRMVETMLERFQHGWKIRDTDCICSVSVGICSYPGYAANAEDLLKYLDLAVSHAREQGSDQYALYDAKLHNKYQRNMAVARYLSTALAKNEIEVRYRPTYNAETKKFTRAEFYMRVFVQGVGMVGSAEFVPIAEDTGQVRALDYYALDKVASKIAELIDEGREFESIALAISPVILQQEDFIEKVASVIKTYHIPAGKLAIEIDEYVLSTATLDLMVLMQELSSMGVELILNNFGSGYSGLTQSLELPVDTLKFDRMFIWRLETNPQSEHIIEGLAQIAAKMGKRLIAEGVETVAQVEALNRFGCGLQQGFYYAPTLPENTLNSVLDATLEESHTILDQEREKLRH